MAIQKFPVGVQTFSEIRKGGYVYIDKTELINSLVEGGKYYFLSRPRRFGKSLLLSTIEAFFQGRRDLFKGLAIDRHEHDWLPHPVFHLNLVNFNSTSTDGLNSILSQHFKYWEDLYGKDKIELDYAQRFYGLIKRASEKSGKQVVVLVDEYDKAIVSSLHNKNLHNSFREILKPIYGTLKAADPYICFALITGVSRFSRLSIFSDINNLRDISLSEDYSEICGITEEEIMRDCRGGLDRLAGCMNLTHEKVASLLKEFYDGYRFSANGTHLYNPFSLFSAFEDGDIKSYWFSTGTPTFLSEAMRNIDFPLPELNGESADAAELESSDSFLANPVPMLFQTGYLTISGYDSFLRSYTLRIPNKEVEEGLFKNLLPVYLNTDMGAGMRQIRKFITDVDSGKPEAFLERLQAFLADIPYDLSGNKPEVYFENNLYIIFKLMGFMVQTEYKTSHGRIDLLVITERFIYVMELKLDGTPEDAIHQIESKGYTIPFHCDRKKLFKIGISFSKTTRNIDRWIIK